jgi:hypothetical protein
MRRDAMFDYFMENTEALRKKGFQAYMSALFLFVIELVLVTAECVEAEIRYPVLIGLTLIAGFMFKDWKDIIDFATPIFADPTKEDIVE